MKKHIPIAELREDPLNPRARQSTFLEDFQRNTAAMHRELEQNPRANQTEWEKELVQLAKLTAQEQQELRGQRLPIPTP